MKWCFFDNNRHCLCCRLWHCLCCRIQLCLWCRIPKGMLSLLRLSTSHFAIPTALLYVWLPLSSPAGASLHRGRAATQVRSRPARDNFQFSIFNFQFVVILPAIIFNFQFSICSRPARDAVRHITLMCVHFSVAGDNQGRGYEDFRVFRDFCETFNSKQRSLTC